MQKCVCGNRSFLLEWTLLDKRISPVCADCFELNTFSKQITNTLLNCCTYYLSGLKSFGLVVLLTNTFLTADFNDSTFFYSIYFRFTLITKQTSDTWLKNRTIGLAIQWPGYADSPSAAKWVRIQLFNIYKRLFIGGDVLAWVKINCFLLLYFHFCSS